MRSDEHIASVRESLQVIKEAIQIGIGQRQRTIGFHCSAAAVDILELYLHERDAISPGKVIKHDFFTSERKAKSKLPEQFDEKEQIIALLVRLEEKRNSLCYGKLKPKEDVENYLTLFRKIREFFDQRGVTYE